MNPSAGEVGCKGQTCDRVRRLAKAGSLCYRFGDIYFQCDVYMPLELDLESVPSVAIGRIHGPWTLSELKDAATQMWSSLESSHRRILWDLEGARLEIDNEEIRQLAEFVKRGAPPDKKVAFVATGDLEFGIARMFDAYRKEDNSRTRVFRDREIALAWLTRGA